MKVRVDPSGPLKGELTPPTDKSISHRVALLGAMADVPVRVRGYLEAADTLSTLAAIERLGALVERRDGEIVIRGAGLRGISDPGGAIDVGNAGTLMRLLPAWLAAQPGRSFTLDGDASIRKRPIDRIAAPLREMGARIEATDGRLPPFTITGGRLQGIRYELPVASAQVKSCVLLAGLLAEGGTTVVEPQPSRDHTERLLAGANVTISRSGDEISVTSADELTLPERYTVPVDPSSAAFAIAAGVLVPGSRLLVRACGVNWTRTGFLRILERMGGIALGDLERRPERGIPDAEPVSDIDVRSGPLLGTVVEAARGSAGDRRAAARRAARLLRGRRDGRARRRGAAPQGVGPHRVGRRRAARARRRDRGDRATASRSAAPAGCAAARSHRTAITAWRCSARSPAWPHARASRSNGMEAADVSYPGFLEDLATLRY